MHSLARLSNFNINRALYDFVDNVQEMQVCSLAGELANITSMYTF